MTDHATALETEPSFLTRDRHEFQKNRKLDEQKEIGTWRNKSKMKTVRVALVLCLNIGTDPPDVVKTSPCARDECWIKTTEVLPPSKALAAVGENLQLQYERWQKRAHYKLLLDPTLEDVKKLCVSLRKSAREERVLFHYNGHGVPRPTSSGEIWMFNKNYTQYIPLAVDSLQSWLGRPAMYVFDCSSASVLKSFFATLESTVGNHDSPDGNKEVIALFAAEENVWLPTNPDFPADIFTACLTTPIKMALRWFLKRNPLSTRSVTVSMLDQLPGSIQDRKSPVGELNWVFTAITDTIAWNVLPRDQFQRLFRQDLLVASLFRNFLLAERIMSSLGCPPSSIPRLPSMAQHPLWDAWDIAAETCLAQLPGLLMTNGFREGSIAQAAGKHGGFTTPSVTPPPQSLDYRAQQPQISEESQKPDEKAMARVPPPFQPCAFFTEQLTAFEVWLEHAAEDKLPPEQLPIVLQVLLSQMHRVRALVLLARFLDLGPWAVDQALSVGIFPYVLKLLQSSAVELRDVLVFIWAKILASDSTCHSELVKDNGNVYFLRHLQSDSTSPPQRVLASFVLSVLMDNGHRAGQKSCLSYKLLKVCQYQLETDDPLLRQWLCLCMGKLWENFSEAQQEGLETGACMAIASRYVMDDAPEVRASAVFALGTLVSYDRLEPPANVTDTQMSLDADTNDVAPEIVEQRRKDHAALQILGQTLGLCQDVSVLVRHELLVALSRLCAHPRHIISLRLVAKSFATIENLKKAATASPRNVSRKARALLGIDAGKGQEATSAGNADDEEDIDHAALEQANLEKAVGSADATQVYVNVWRVLHQMEKSDPFEKASNLAGVLLRQCQLEGPDNTVDSTRKRRGNASIDTDSLASSGLKRQMSAPNLQSNHLVNPTRLSVDVGLSGIGGKAQASNSTSRAHKIANNAGTFYRWCYSGFSKPLLKYNEENILDIELDHAKREAEEWDSLNEETVHRGWLRRRNRNMILTARSMASGRPEAQGEGGLNVPLVGIENFSGVEERKFDQSAILDNESEMTSKLLFHPFEPILVASDSRDGITVWNFEEGVKVKRFSNKNRSGTRITALEWLNEHQSSLLAVGTDDGVVRVWSGKQKRHHTSAVKTSRLKPKDQLVWNSLEDAGFVFAGEGDDGYEGSTPRDTVHGSETSTHRSKENMVTAWNAAPDLVPTNRGSGMVTSWQQANGRLYVGGNTKFIRSWDLVHEKCAMSIVSGTTDACLTSMTSLFDENRNSRAGEIVAGFADGSLRVYDERVGAAGSAIIMSNANEHRNWIVNVSMQRGHMGALVTGSVLGDIKIWDIRNGLSTSVKTLDADKEYTMTTMAVQDYAPVIASGSHNQFIKILNTAGKILSVIRYHDGFLGQRIGPVSCLAFHPHLPVLASGAVDPIIAIYKASTRKR
jgi:regulator-associated protein of mTOR